MKKLLCLICGLLISLNVSAREVADVRLAETAQVGNATLQLNGAGTRTRVIIDVYVAALYLAAKTNRAEVVLADQNNKRVALHLSLIHI